MAAKRIVLVDGVAGYWGGRVAGQLIEDPGLHVIGLDIAPPEKPIKDLDFVQADIRNPLLVELLREERVEVVCHLAFLETTRPNEASFDLNVIGAIKLMGACAEAGVRRVVLMSSTMVYGAHPMNSTYLNEDQPLNGSKSYGYIRDLVEVESFVNSFRVQYPETSVTSLRFAHIVGANADTPMIRFLREEEAFVLLGFDPLMQVIHEQDVAGALVHAVTHNSPGMFNVAAEGVMPLWKLMGLAGKITSPVFHPIAYLAVSVLGPRYAPIDLDYLRYPCVGDLTRMHDEFHFAPQYTAEESIREFAAQQRLKKYIPDPTAGVLEEERLRDTISRRRRARERAVQEEKRARALKRRSAARRAAHRIKAQDTVTALDQENDHHGS